MKTLVLDGDTVPALAIVRSLGRQGIPVDIAAHTDKPLCRYSKYTNSSLQYPHPLQETEQFLKWLEAFIESTDYQLIIPATERTLVPMARHFHNSPLANHITMPPLEALETVLDKARTSQLAIDCDVPQAESWTVDTLDQLDTLAEQLSYPIVIKPGRSISDNKERVTLTVRYAHSFEELQKISKELLGHVHLVLQRYFDGVGVGIELIARQGEILYAFQHQRLHEMPLTGGGSSYRKSTDINTALLEASRRLIAKLNWHGVAMVEFKLNPENGEFILIEINGRFWGSLPLAIAAGADFPYQLFQLYTTGKVAALTPYRPDIYCRKLSSDLGWLEAVVRKDADTRLVAIPSLGAALKDWLKVFSPRHFFDVQSFKDINPGLQDLKHIGNTYLQRLTGIYEEKKFRRSVIKRSHHTFLQKQLTPSKNILFICYGNINRSAIAHALAEAELSNSGLSFRSAGFHPVGERPADHRMVAVADNQGINMSDFRSTILTTELAEWADLIFVMEAVHVSRLAQMSETAAAKSYLLGGLIVDNQAIEIPDPYNKPQQVYQETFEKVSQCIAGMNTLLTRIQTTKTRDAR